MEVSRDGTTLVTLHGGTDTTARDDAAEEVAETLAGLESETRIVDWEVLDTAVEEHPAAPFDPYTVAVAFRVVVDVDATDGDASDRGAERIEEVLASARIEPVTYTSPPVASN